MSHRQVKKIIEKQKKEIVEESDEEVERKNIFFDLSDDAGEEPDEIESENIRVNSVSHSESSISTNNPLKEPEIVLTSEKKPKKKSNKKKKNHAGEKKDKEFEDLMKELNSSESQNSAEKVSQITPCLKRSAKHFDSSYELNKLFHEKTKFKSSSHQKTFILTPGLDKKNNQHISYLPTMEQKNEKFYFEMSKGYLKLYQDYLFCIESNNAGFLHDFSNKYPFHIESLHQLALIYKLQAKYEQVFQILERILLCFQISFHHQFSPIGKNIGMDMNATNLNKVFFKSLFMMIDCLGRKGCYRTALEYVKFLLSLDPKDPMGCLCLIDFYSISTKKYLYFCYFCDNFMKEFYGVNKSLITPTTIYSLALSKALISNNFSITEEDSNKAFTIRDLSQISNESGSVILLCAVSTFPLICQNLLKKLAPTFDFLTENENISFDYSVLAEIYALRNLELWRSDLCVNWLKKAADEVEIIGPKDYTDVWEYSQLDPADFTFTARALIPADFGK